MISAVAFVPQAPLLVPALTGGQTSELAQLRAACRAAIRQVAVPGRDLVVVGSGAADAFHAPNARGSLAAFGVPLEIPLGSDEPGPVGLPGALTVGAWLVRDALGPNTGAVGYSVTAGLPDLWDDVDRALVVLGDGTVRRSENDSDHVGGRAAGLDARITDALRRGDASRLHREPDDDDGESWAAGAPAWDAVARLIESAPFDAELLYDSAPFGVSYFVAVWTRRD